MKKNEILFTLLLNLIMQSLQLTASDNKGQIVAANDTCQRIDRYLTNLEKEKGFSGGLLIIRNGETVFSKGYGWSDRTEKIPFTPMTLASIGSITKAFTATAVMRLHADGKLKLTDPLSKFFPGAPADKEGINIHQLLTHSSGLSEFLEDDGGDFALIETQEFLRRLWAQPLAFEPGSTAIYSNVGYSLLAIIIEQVSGTDYESYLKKAVLGPVGINGIGYYADEPGKKLIAHGYRNGKDWGTHPQHYKEAGGGPYWNLKGNGGLEASLEDMARWANAFTNKTILPSPLITLMHGLHMKEEGTDGKYFFGYGCNISLSRRNTTLIDNGGSNGIYFARLIRLPKEKLVMYVITNESSVNANMVLPNISQLWFEGVISTDHVMDVRVGHPDGQRIYDILVKEHPSDLGAALEKEKIKIENDMTLFETGEALKQNNHPEEAITLYRYYTQSFPGIVLAWNELGELYLEKGDKPSAAECFRTALKIKPENERAKDGLAKAIVR